jgi:hypothetical protein
VVAIDRLIESGEDVDGWMRPQSRECVDVTTFSTHDESLVGMGKRKFKPVDEAALIKFLFGSFSYHVIFSSKKIWQFECYTLVHCAQGSVRRILSRHLTPCHSVSPYMLHRPVWKLIISYTFFFII